MLMQFNFKIQFHFINNIKALYPVIDYLNFKPKLKNFLLNRFENLRSCSVQLNFNLRHIACQ